MKVGILYSGGKDSTYAIQHAKEKGWDIRYLLSVKPARKDCFLFHYATVEHTPKLAEIIGIRHILTGCDVADPVKEADIVKKIVEQQQKNDPVDAVVLGGTGLQETQLKSIQKALLPMKIEVFAAQAGLDHDEIVEDMLKKGYKILITQVASDGLINWLGREITLENFGQFKKDSLKFGFHIGGEGGYYDTFVYDAPIFSKKLEILERKTIAEDAYNGHVEIKIVKVVNKAIQSEVNQ